MPTPSLYMILRNARLHTQQWIVPRGGLTAVSNIALNQLNVHSIKRLNDKIANLFPRIIGAGTQLYVGEGTAPVDSGYSGNPLSMFAYRPEASPQPWMYVADSQRLRKVRSDGLVHTVGIEPPLGAPTVTLGTPSFQLISDFEAIGAWTNQATAGAISVVTRLNTTIAKIIYDAGSTGWASIQPTTFTDQIQRGMFVIVNNGGGTQETVLVDDIYPIMTPSTIGSIQYDSGATGLCTIQPVAASASKSHFPFQPGLGDRGGIRPPGPIGVRPGRFSVVGDPRVFPGPLPVGPIGRPTPPPQPPPVRSSSTKPVGVQANSLIRINAGGGTDEIVRVLAISVGKDGTVSFRASTVNNHVAGEALAGVASFRVFLVNNHVAAETLTNSAFQTTVTAGTGSISLVTAFNLGVAGGRSVQEDDEIHISLRFDHPEFLTEARVIFDLDSATNDFNHNYLYYAVRQSDMQQAVTSGTTNIAARQAALNRALLTTYARSLAPRQRGPNVLRDDGPDPTGVDPAFRPGGAIGTSHQAKTGATQWTEFRFKVKDLVRVGADTTRNLSNVAAIRIQFIVSSTVVANVDALWIGGTFGPDIGEVGSPIFYRFRGRSKITGVRSLAGPPTRMGIEPHRHRVSGTMAQHPNPSVDTLDVYRFGGSLDQWYYVLSTANTASPAFNDDLDDTSVQEHPTLDLDLFQPFPTLDVLHSGTVNVVGTKVSQQTGDTFNIFWYPGSQININGVYYTLYAQPSDANHLEIVENAGTQVGVPYFINNATILGNPLPVWWGPYAEGTAAFFFACGDKFQAGTLFVTNGNDPDAASDTLQIEVCSVSEPLINGGVYDTTPYVFSSDGLFRCYPNIGGSGGQLFIPRRVPGSKGLFSKWGLAQGKFIYALGKDGIYRTDLSTYDSITAQDLRLLFPHDGVPGQTILIGSSNVAPPDMTQLSKLRLSYYDDHLYFDFVDSFGTPRTLVYDEIFQIWSIDDYTPQIVTHYGDEGESQHGIFCGGPDGKVYQMGAGILDGTGVNFPMEIRSPQIGELPTAFHVTPNGIIGIQSTSGVNLGINVDGIDSFVVLPSTSGNFLRLYTWMPAVKGKLLAFELQSNTAFSVDRRECQFQIGAWGRAQTAELASSGSMGPVNPFSDLRRAYGPKVN